MVGAPLLIGPIIDIVGPRRGAFVGSLGLMAGFVLLSTGSYPDRDWFVVGFALIAACGTMVQFTTWHVSTLYPKNQNLVMGLLSCLFGVSAIVFVVLHLIYRAGVPLRV